VWILITLSVCSSPLLTADQGSIFYFIVLQGQRWCHEGGWVDVIEEATLMNRFGDVICYENCFLVCGTGLSELWEIWFTFIPTICLPPSLPGRQLNTFSSYMEWQRLLISILLGKAHSLSSCFSVPLKCLSAVFCTYLNLFTLRQPLWYHISRPDLVE